MEAGEDVVEITEIETSHARLALIPSLGGGIASLTGLTGQGRWEPVLRPWNGRLEDGPFALASIVLVPFSNRVSGGGFPFDGQFRAMRPNLPGEALAIHGDGFQRQWQIEEKDDARVVLSCRDGAIGPYRYEARQTFVLWGQSLLQELSVRNLSGATLPFGLGFHPYFPRSDATNIKFSAGSVWLQDQDFLPSDRIPVEPGSEWDFSALRRLPSGWINNGFDDWGRTAIIAQQSMTITISASPVLSRAIVFSPSQEADFFCFEPVSHPVDAHNLEGQPGLVRIGPNEELDCWMEISWH